MKRKILAIFATLCLIISAIPMSVGAAEADFDKWDGTSVSLDWITGSATYDGTYENKNTRTHQAYPIDALLSEPTADTKYYKVTGYEAGTTFVLDSAADLAGLAALMNTGAEHKAKGWFDNCTFVITKNIDLDNKKWTPIGKSNSYDIGAAMIVGSLGKADGTGSAITVKNLKMELTDNGGFVGTQQGGGMKNIIMDTVTIDATAGAVAPFVGYSKGDAKFTPVYENLTAKNVTMNGTATGDGRLGGIIGYLNATGTISNCHFEGSIINSGKQTGGIVGHLKNENTILNCSVKGTINGTNSGDEVLGGIAGRGDGAALTVKNCTVDASIINDGVGRTGGIAGFVPAGITVSDCVIKGEIIGNALDTGRGGVGGVSGLERGVCSISNVVVLSDISSAAVGGAGGIVGLQDKAISDNSKVTISKCYVASDITGEKSLGGFIGTAQAENTIVDCQFDGTIIPTATEAGAFIGTLNALSGGTKLTLTNCLNTGFAMNCNEESAKQFALIGLAAKDAGAGEIILSGCYTNMPLELAGVVTAEGIWAVNTDKTFAASKPAAVTLDNMNATGLAGYDFTNTWVAVTGKVATLKNAQSYVSAYDAVADLSWFTPAFLTNKSVEIANASQLAGLAKIAPAVSAKDYKVNIADGVALPTEADFGKDWYGVMYQNGVLISTITPSTPDDGNDNTDNGGNNETPADTEAKPADTTAAPAPAETQAPEKKGCGSMVGASVLLIAVAAITPVLVRRKEND